MCVLLRSAEIPRFAIAHAQLLYLHHHLALHDRHRRVDLSSIEHVVASTMTASSPPPLDTIKGAAIAARIRGATTTTQGRR
jgi:hypothetical protein